MPKTLAGFCLLSGIILLFYSIIQGPVGGKDYKLPKLSGVKRMIIGFMGILLTIVSIWLYVSGKEGIPVAYPLNQKNITTMNRVMRDEQKALTKETHENLTPKDKIDKQKFERVYRVAKTLTATVEGGISYLKLQELNQDFLTEISIAEDSVTAGKEKEVIALYKSAYETYKISETVWRAIIKYNLDNYGDQYPNQAKAIFETLKPIIEQFGLVLISKVAYDGDLMHELHTAELRKIWVVANEYIDKANAIVMGKTPN
jgi:hypothetical protein